MSGCSPFLGDSKQETLSNVSAMRFDFDGDSFANTSEMARQFIRSLLVKNPRSRASVDDCLAHPWINVSTPPPTSSSTSSFAWRTFVLQPIDVRQVRYRRSSSINLDNLKSFVARSKWKVRYLLVTHVLCDLCPPSTIHGLCNPTPCITEMYTML